MKKVLSVMIAAVMLLSASTTVFAVKPAETSAQTAVEVKHNSEYMFSYTEQTDANYSIVRTYTNESAAASANARTASTMAVDPAQSETSTERVKAILLSLGMGQDFIDMLSEEDLEDYANCEMMMGITSYTKEDADGNVVNVPEEEALANARLGSFPEQDLVDPIPGGVIYSTRYEDAYMSIFYMVCYMEDGLYKFSVDATWLTDPIQRFTDSIGACSQNFTVENATRSGWYKYVITEDVDGYYSSYENVEVFDNFKTVTNGNWCGSAAIFDLYSISYLDDDGDYSVSSNHKVHYQFKGYVNYPNVEAYFNTVATYSHTVSIPFFEPSISISSDGTGAVSIGLGLRYTTEDRTAEFANSIHYVPN